MSSDADEFDDVSLADNDGDGADAVDNAGVVSVDDSAGQAVSTDINDAKSVIADPQQSDGDDGEGDVAAVGDELGDKVVIDDDVDVVGNQSALATASRADEFAPSPTSSDSELEHGDDGAEYGRGPDLKILTLGDSGVGKSNLLIRLADNTFRQNHSSTIGIDFRARLLRVAAAKLLVNLQVWDTAGQVGLITLGFVDYYSLYLSSGSNHARLYQLLLALPLLSNAHASIPSFLTLPGAISLHCT
jgi:hypothetical protein